MFQAARRQLCARRRCARLRSLASLPEFGSAAEYRAHLEAEHAALPLGFRVGTAALGFTPSEAPHMDAKMVVTLIVPDEPTPDFGAVFTRNAFPGAPVKIGRLRLDAPALGAVVVNNKISNVCAKGGGVADSEALCDAVAAALGLEGGGSAVLPSSTGVIGWRLPVAAMLPAVPAAVAALQPHSALPAAEGIMTTDLYPKCASATLPSCGARVVGIAKGAGMIEPNMATMLGFILTDAAVPREELRAALADVTEATFNSISVDSDQSTSDTVAVLSSGRVAGSDAAVQRAEFRAALREVCAQLAEGVVRNGEGCNHLLRVRVAGAPDAETARAVGKAVVNGNLFKCAVSGNDPNVGRIAGAVGDCIGNRGGTLVPEDCTISMGGLVLMKGGEFNLDGAVEQQLVAYMAAAEQKTAAGEYPDYWPHSRAVEIDVDLGQGDGSAEVLGSDLTDEYVRINGDYRS